MSELKVGDMVTCNGCYGEVVEILEAKENPQDKLYLIRFGYAGNFRLRDSEITVISHTIKELNKWENVNHGIYNSI